ncbi:MAG: Fic family protein [Chloroflexota bacterium]|nr:Fic family protein [Chloroflexota bacterium]
MPLPQTAPSQAALSAEFVQLDAEQQVALLTDAHPLDDKDRYLPWDEIRYRTPPAGRSARLHWFGMAMARRASARTLPLLGRGDQPFWYCNAQPVLAALNRLDQAQRAHILADETLMTNAARRRWLQRGLMEESIQSSRLEGANTSRLLAREMLHDGRPPRDKSERMIANNFAAMQTVEEWATNGDSVDLEHILRLHQVVAAGTMHNENDAGRLQRPGEARVYVVSASQEIVHRPPPADELPERMQRITDFADLDPDGEFVHPLVRAILLHFMIGYDHPFVDGNGRTARALFYWSLLRSGWWLAPYLPISHFLLQAPAQYSRAYQHVTADNNDVTHFLLHQLDIMDRAVEQLGRDLQAEAAATRDLLERLGETGFSERQFAIIDAALKQPNRIFTIAQQQNEHRVSYWAARADLQNLTERGFLQRQRSGKKFVFRPAPDLLDRLGGS